MITNNLPETEPHIKTLRSQGLGLPLDLTQRDNGPVVRALSSLIPASIVIRLNVHGMLGAEVIAGQSDEEDILRQRLKAAEPLLNLLRKIFTVQQPLGIQ